MPKEGVSPRRVCPSQVDIWRRTTTSLSHEPVPMPTAVGSADNAAPGTGVPPSISAERSRHNSVVNGRARGHSACRARETRDTTLCSLPSRAATAGKAHADGWARVGNRLDRELPGRSWGAEEQPRLNVPAESMEADLDLQSESLLCSSLCGCFWPSSRYSVRVKTSDDDVEHAYII